MVAFLIVAFIILVDLVLLANIVSIVLSLFDRFEPNGVSKQSKEEVAKDGKRLRKSNEKHC